MAKKPEKAVNTAEQMKKVQEKKEAFVRVVTPRMRKAIKAISYVGLCASPTYISSDLQKRACVEALKAAVSEVESAFASGGKTAGGFNLPE